jgi:hypothetical protein
MAEVLRRAQRAAVGGVVNLDPAVHVLKSNVCATAAQLATRLVADEPMMIDSQAAGDLQF